MKEFQFLIEQGQVQWGDINLELYVNALLTFLNLWKQLIHLNNWVKLSPVEIVSNFTQVSSAMQVWLSFSATRCYYCGGSHPFIQCTKHVQRLFRVLQRFKYQSPQQTKFANLSKSSHFTKQGSNTNPTQ